MILFLFLVCEAEVDLSSTQYPFPTENIVAKDLNIDEPLTDCVIPLLGDGKCDGFNNKEICNYDGGDCCRYTCELNCVNGCPYTCGSKGYNCLQDTSCANCVHGTCKPMSACFATADSVLVGFQNCLSNSTVHGSNLTNNFYCGLDPYKDILHDYAQLDFHYAGCGLLPEICSVYQCCSDIEINHDTLENCNDTVRNASVFNLDTHSFEFLEISCIDQYQACFINNSRLSKGECCECDVGWAGKDCDVPSCYPQCQNGYCASLNFCECDSGWEGLYCEKAICENCVNGSCVEPNYCLCNYGWTGPSCNVPYATPQCLNGIAIAPDVCKCIANYTGDRCDVPVCSQCNHGWCVSPGICECYPPYYTSSLTASWCNDLYCNEIFGQNCLNCTNFTCTACEKGFFLLGSSCLQCSEIDINCVVCTFNSCSACVWPYSPIGNACFFGGFLEFSSKYYWFLKSEGNVNVPVYRIGSLANNVSISYFIVPITASPMGLADFGYSSGTLFFSAGVSEQVINIVIYNSFIDKNYVNSLYLILYDPVGGLIHNTDLPPISDPTWSDKGISIISYSVLEILDDPRQAFPPLTNLFQAVPDTVKVGQTFTISFTAFNSFQQTTNSATFIVNARIITQLGPVVNCLFWTNDFNSQSTIFNNFLAQNSTENYFFNFYALVRGMFRFRIFVALWGCYLKIFTNQFFAGSPSEYGIRQIPGFYNNFTVPLGNSSSIWNFVYFPDSDFNGIIQVFCSFSDKITVSINEVVVINCIGSCNSSQVQMYQNSGYWFNIQYVHYQVQPGFQMNLIDNVNGLYNFNQIYALNNTEKTADLYVINDSEC